MGKKHTSFKTLIGFTWLEIIKQQVGLRFSQQNNWQFQCFSGHRSGYVSFYASAWILHSIIGQIDWSPIFFLFCCCMTYYHLPLPFSTLKAVWSDNISDWLTPWELRTDWSKGIQYHLFNQLDGMKQKKVSYASLWWSKPYHNIG